MSDITLKVLLFQGVVFFLLAAVLVSRRFFRQPVDRIRLVQVGFALVVAAAVCVGVGIGPTWTINYRPFAMWETANQSPLSLWERDGVRAFSDPNNPHPPYPINMALPEGEEAFALLQDVSPLEQRALSSTDTSPPSRPYSLMEQENRDIRAQQSVEKQRAASVAGRNLRVPDQHVLYPQVTAEYRLHLRLFEKTFFILLLLPPLFFFLRDFIAGHRLRKLLRNSHTPSEAITEMFRQVRGNSQRAVRLRVSNDIAAPMVFGLFRPTLLLPARLCSAPVQELRACLVHEWSHLKNGDLLTWNLVRFFQYPLWMQPFYWMLRSRLLADQDFLADDDGVQACTEAADYAQILYTFAQTRSVAEVRCLGMAGRKSQLRRRIDMLFNATKLWCMEQGAFSDWTRMTRKVKLFCWQAEEQPVGENTFVCRTAEMVLLGE